jgi:hypothetical protein
MTGMLVVFLLGIAAGVYAYKPYVTVISMLGGYRLFRKNEEVSYEYTLHFILSKEDYKTFRKFVEVKPRSYMHYITFVKNNITPNMVRTYYKVLLKDKLLNLAKLSLVVIVLPMLLFISSYIWLYIVGFILVIAYNWAYKYFVDYKKSFYELHLMVSVTINQEWNNKHRARSKDISKQLPIEQENNLATQANATSTEMELLLPIKILKYMAIAVSFIFPIAILGTLVVAALKIVPPEDNALSDFMVVSVMAYIAIMALLGLLYFVVYFLIFLYYRRPQ